MNSCPAPFIDQEKDDFLQGGALGMKHATLMEFIVVDGSFFGFSKFFRDESSNNEYQVVNVYPTSNDAN